MPKLAPRPSSVTPLPQLTGLRALAAWSVGICHHYFHVPASFPAQSYVESWLKTFYIGVNIFFILSGFLIAYNYFDSAAPKVNWLKKYFLRRFARIYPLYFLLLLITLVNLPDRDPWSWLLNFSLFKGFFDDFKFNGIGPAWSLTVEESFYLGAPLLFFYLKRFKKIRLTQFLPILGLSISTGMLLAFLGEVLHWHGFFGDITFVFTKTIFGRCFEFLSGVYLACFLAEKRKIPDILKNHLTYVGLLGTLLLGAAMGTYGDSPFIEFSAKRVFIEFVLMSIMICVLILGLVRENTLLSRTLRSAPMQLLGKSSYAYYLIHTGFFSWLVWQSVGQGGLWAHFLGCNALAVGLYLFWEAPLNQLLRRRFEPHAAPSTGAAVKKQAPGTAARRKIQGPPQARSPGRRKVIEYGARNPRTRATHDSDSKPQRG